VLDLEEEDLAVWCRGAGDSGKAEEDDSNFELFMLRETW
jgi:hypothetical protein